jgi:hypothetical protein
MNLMIACLDRELPANDRVFQLLVEEYKSLREEIGRFQNQQKQLIAAAIAGLAAVGAGLLSQSQTTIVRYPELLLLGPLFFGTLSLLFFRGRKRGHQGRLLFRRCFEVKSAKPVCWRK